MLYQHIIQVENKKVGLKVEGHKHTIAPPVKKVGGGAHAPLAPPLPTPVIYIYMKIHWNKLMEWETKTFSRYIVLIEARQIHRHYFF